MQKIKEYMFQMLRRGKPAIHSLSRQNVPRFVTVLNALKDFIALRYAVRQSPWLQEKIIRLSYPTLVYENINELRP